MELSISFEDDAALKLSRALDKGKGSEVFGKTLLLIIPLSICSMNTFAAFCALTETVS
jgi:hypothetical protein